MANSYSSDASTSVLLVGAGKMGSALLSGWLEQEGAWAISVADPFLEEDEYRQYEDAGVTFIESPQDLAVKPEAIVFAVKPQQLKELTPAYAAIAQDALVISVAAGVRIATLESLLGERTAILRAMPNLPAQVGMGITAFFPNKRVRLAHMELSERLLGAVGATLAVTVENQIDAVTAISGSGPAYVFLLAECLEMAAMEVGLDPEAAQILARATIAGSGGLLGMIDADASQLRESVTSPGGTTHAALKVLLDERNGLQQLLTKAVVAARNRARELGE